MRIQKRLGSLGTKNAINYLLEDNYTECFRILLVYYDKFYNKDLDSRSTLQHKITTIKCARVDAKTNSVKLVKQLSDGITNTGD